MSKRHQHKASGKKTRTGQDRKSRRKQKQFLDSIARSSGKSKSK